MQVASTRATLPHLEVFAVAPNERPLLESHAFDLVVLLDVQHSEGNRLDLSSRMQTARWLTALRPQGRLAYLQRTDAVGGHRPECWERHLACFPGRMDRLSIADSWSLPSTWQALRTGTPRARTEWLTLTLPMEALALEDWRDYARRGLLTSQRACCAAGAASAPPQHQRISA